jgi:hypothetical protein
MKKVVISYGMCYSSNRMILNHFEILEPRHVKNGARMELALEPRHLKKWGPDGAHPGTMTSQEKGPGWSSPWNQGMSRKGARLELALEPCGNC